MEKKQIVTKKTTRLTYSNYTLELTQSVSIFEAKGNTDHNRNLYKT